jgi:hypothetical protein
MRHRRPVPRSPSTMNSLCATAPVWGGSACFCPDCFAPSRICESLLSPTHRSDVICLCDSSASIEGVLFYGSPWQPEFNAWAFNLPRGDALKAKWDLIPVGTDVLITHGPPSGIGDRSPSHGRTGCEELLEATLRVAPALHLFGHIHQDGGAWERPPTCFANVTTWECERGPTVVDIEPVSRRLSLVDVPPPDPSNACSGQATLPLGYAIATISPELLVAT